MTKASKGFTLLEAMAFVAMIGILVTLAAPSFSAALRRRQVNKFAHEVASVIYQARSAAMTKRRTTQVIFKTGNILVLTQDDQKWVLRYPSDISRFYDRNLSIVTNNYKLFINANGFVVDGNGHAINRATLNIIDAATGETIPLFVNYAGSIDWG